MCKSCEEIPSDSTILRGDTTSLVCADFWFNHYYSENVNNHPEFVDFWIQNYGTPDKFGETEDEQRDYYIRMAFAFIGWTGHSEYIVADPNTRVQSVTIGEGGLAVNANVEIFRVGKRSEEEIQALRESEKKE